MSRRYSTPRPTDHDGTPHDPRCGCDRCAEYWAWIDTRAESIKEDREPVWHREEWE